MNKRSIKNLLPYFAIAMFSFALLLVTSFSTSPLYIIKGFDSVEYKLAGAAILDGLVIFKDVFHQKGALFMFVEAFAELIGRLLSNERIGTFIIQLINYAFSSSLFYAGLNYVEKKPFKRIIITVSVMIFWIIALEYGNLTEELSMIFSAASVYITLKAYSLDFKIKNYYGFVLGICLICGLFYKPTVAIVTISCILFLFFSLLANKEYKLLTQNCIFGFLGICFILVPIIAYYWSNGALKDLIDQCLLFNFRYYFERNDRLVENNAIHFYFLIVIVALPIVSLISCIITRFEKLSVFSLILSALTLVMYIFSSTTYFFYLQIEVSAFFVTLIAVSKAAEDKNKIIEKTILILSLAGLTAIYGAVLFVYCGTMLPANTEHWRVCSQQIEEFKNNTDELMSDSDKPNDLFILTDDYLVNRYFYYSLQRYPFSNVFSQEFFKGCNAKPYIDKFNSDLENNPPRYIIKQIDFNHTEGYKSTDESYEVLDKIESEYTQIYQDDAYILYKINQNAG